MSESSRGHGLDAHLDLLDRQIVDNDGLMVAKVDDVELEEREDGRLVVSGLLTGPGALGPRLRGSMGSIVTASWSRLSGRPEAEPKRIDASAVQEYGVVIKLGISRKAADVDGFEVWMRDRVISALPASGKEPA